MTRYEYMQALKEKLQNYDPALAQEILEDYEMHFAEGLSAGRSEEEIIRELGDMDEMLREITAGDQDRSLTISEDQTNLQKQYDQLYRGVVIKGLLADVDVSASETGRLNVFYRNECNTAMKLRYRFYQYEEDGIFYAGVEDTGFKSKLGVLSYVGQFGRGVHLSVQVPAGIPVLKISTQSGDLNITDVTADEIIMESQSGDIEMTGVSAGKIAANTGSGDIEGSEFRCDQLAANAGSGDIELKKISVESCTLNAGSGDIELEDITAGSCTINTGSGDIDLSVLPGIKRIALNTGSGDVNLDLRQIPSVSIKAESHTGDLTIRGKKLSDNHYSDPYDGASCTANIKTGGGDINIL